MAQFLPYLESNIGMKNVFNFNFILIGSTQLIESEIQDVSYFLFSDRNVFNVTLWA